MLHPLTLRWWCRVALWWRGVVAAADPLLLMGGHLVANIAGQRLLGLSLPCPNTVRHLSEVLQCLLTVFAVHQLKEGEESNNKYWSWDRTGGRMEGSGEKLKLVLV